MGTKLLLGFGGTVIQVVVHPQSKYRHLWQRKLDLGRFHLVGFGGTVNQAVVHLMPRSRRRRGGFGKYRNPSSSSPQSLPNCRLTAFRRYGNPGNSSPIAALMTGVSEFRKYRKPSSSSPSTFAVARIFSFGGTVIQAVFHLDAEDVGVEGGFGGTVN